ncbi:MAG: hypothetical protein HW389_2725 [Bacteroidetes bacterium]|nr:hypothetical protein [Bacteroidota bacterium]
MKKWVPRSLVAMLIVYAVLLIPDPEPRVSLDDLQGGSKKAFAWNQDAFWTQLEKRYIEARATGCEGVRHPVDSLLAAAKKNLAYINQSLLEPENTVFRQHEKLIFGIGSLVAPCPERFTEFRQLVEESRKAIKRQSERWDMSKREARETLYRLLYGGRGAVEEIMLQRPADSTKDPLTLGTDEPSQTPSASILGVTIHSGDILVSRGGAPTSALIARGNDFPGNFSHIALVYVHPTTRIVRIIESHIERGVVVTTQEEYLNDVKLRVMVLRLRSDLPQMQADPMLPHRAADLALRAVGERHIPYDFSMDFGNSEKWFCSEAASVAYKKFGVQLWMGLSHLSSPGLRAWLSGFGVEHFETQEPSDLEYDPQLRVVAEWRDPDRLRKDHNDNAVTEVMLEGAEAGDRLTYAWYLLPVARIMKAYSSTLNLLGKQGPVPEGMSAAAALRNRFYSGRHDAIKSELTRLAHDFEGQKGYAAPYWGLLQMARDAKRTVEGR